MTDRVNAVTLVLAHDIRVDDIEPLVQAVKQLRGVIDVQLNIADTQTLIAEARADQRWRERLIELIQRKP